jgi:hypothetical protein
MLCHALQSINSIILSSDHEPMRVRQGRATLSATDLANHLSCRHLTTLDLRLAKGEIAEPSWEVRYA